MPVNGKSRRSYRGAPVSNTLGVTLSAAATNITLAVAISGWSTDAEPFFVVVDPGTAKEEKICVKYSSSTTLTVVDPAVTSTWGASAAGRGADNTTDRQHEQGAVIYPVFTATEANNANELVSKYANAGSVVYQGPGTPGTFTELAIGTAGQALKVNAGATAPEWGQIPTAGIADSAVTLAKLATALQAYLVPVGTISAYAGVTAPTGWLLCNGTSTTGYTALAALVGATTPDMRGRFPIGDNATLTLLGTGGSLTISTSNMPSHSHTQDAHNHTQDAHNHTQNSHNHTQDAHNHTQNSHGHTQDAHNHTQDAHDHTTNSVVTFTTAAHLHDNADYFAAAVNGGSVTSGGGSSIFAATATNQATTATNQATTATNIATTATNIATTATNNAATATNQATVATNQATGGGTDYYQPYLVVNYIIKHD
jgi:microcystin-dependent protein